MVWFGSRRLLWLHKFGSCLDPPSFINPEYHSSVFPPSLFEFNSTTWISRVHWPSRYGCTMKVKTTVHQSCRKTAGHLSFYSSKASLLHDSSRYALWSSCSSSLSRNVLTIMFKGAEQLNFLYSVLIQGLAAQQL